MRSLGVVLKAISFITLIRVSQKQERKVGRLHIEALYELDIREADLYFGPVTDMKSLRLTLSTIDLLGVTTEYLLTAALS